jgi:hypothetical protein
MKYFAYTLVADGPSDDVLMSIIDWMIRTHTNESFSSNFCSSAEASSHDLVEKIGRANDIYPCDVLFVHRDCERPENYARRLNEISAAVALKENRVFVPIVPVRMTEAWLLFDEAAIRSAANNRNGTVALDLPALRRLDDVLDPKDELQRVLRAATERSARRLHSFDARVARRRIPAFIDDYSPLRRLASFADFEAATKEALRQLGA